MTFDLDLVIGGDEEIGFVAALFDRESRLGDAVDDDAGHGFGHARRDLDVADDVAERSALDGEAQLCHPLEGEQRGVCLQFGKALDHLYLRLGKACRNGRRAVVVSARLHRGGQDAVALDEHIVAVRVGQCDVKIVRLGRRDRDDEAVGIAAVVGDRDDSRGACGIRRDIALFVHSDVGELCALDLFYAIGHALVGRVFGRHARVDRKAVKVGDVDREHSAFGRVEDLDPVSRDVDAEARRLTGREHREHEQQRQHQHQYYYGLSHSAPPSKR